MILFGCEEDHIQEEVVQSQRNPELVTLELNVETTEFEKPYLPNTIEITLW